MKIQFICRGSLAEGLGHLFRTRTLARYASSHHQVEVLAMVEHDLEGLLADLPCPVRTVRHDLDLIPWIVRFAPDVLVYDTTRIDPFVFQTAAPQALLNASISPVFDHARHLDILFTRIARSEPIPGVQIQGGLQYAIFSDHCRPIPDDLYERNLALPELPIAISMGGADAANKTLAVLRAILDIPEPTTVYVLLGEGYAHSYNALVEKVRGDSRHEVILAKTNRSMWRIMAQAAVGILAGGLTTIEAVYAGLPTLNILDQPRHRHLLSELFDASVCLDGGHFCEQSLDQARHILRRLHRHREELRAMRSRTTGLVDAHGPQRVLEVLEREFAARCPAHPSTHAVPALETAHAV